MLAFIAYRVINNTVIYGTRNPHNAETKGVY